MKKIYQLSIILFSIVYLLGCSNKSNHQQKKHVSVEFYKVEEEVKVLTNKYKILQSKHPKEAIYTVNITPIITNDMIDTASTGFSSHNNSPLINITLTSSGKEIFTEYTSKNIGSRVAIVLNNEVYSAPVIRETISQGKVQITGSFSLEEAQAIVNALNSKE